MTAQPCRPFLLLRIGLKHRFQAIAALRVAVAHYISTTGIDRTLRVRLAENHVASVDAISQRVMNNLTS
jgi:hypothetical protein